MYPEAGDALASLPVNGAGGRLLRLGHLEEVVVRVDADQDARTSLGIVVVLGLREQQVEADGVERHTVERSEHTGGPVRVLVGLNRIIERRVGKMQRVGPPLAAAVKAVEDEEDRLGSKVRRRRKIDDRRVGVLDRLLGGVDGRVQLPGALDRAEVIFARHRDGRLARVAVLHGVERIGVRLQERLVDDVGGVEDLLGDQLRLFVLAVRIFNPGHPLRRLQPAAGSVGGVLGLKLLGRRILHEPDIAVLAPHLGEKIRWDIAAGVEDNNIGRAHTGGLHQLPHGGQDHLRRGVGIVVELLALAVIKVDLKRDDLAGLVPPMFQLPCGPIVVFENRLPGLLGTRGAGERKQRGSEHRVDARLVGVGIQPPLVGLLLPAAGPVRGQRVVRPHHPPREDPAGHAHRLIRRRRHKLELRRNGARLRRQPTGDAQAERRQQEPPAGRGVEQARNRHR